LLIRGMKNINICLNRHSLTSRKLCTERFGYLYSKFLFLRISRICKIIIHYIL
jgi:hypothetical protein